MRVMVLTAAALLAACGRTDGRAPGVEHKNPAGLAPPVADYSHVAVVPAGADILVFAGQIGADPKGNLPAGAEAQFENALANVRKLLASEHLGPEHIVKANIWLAAPIDRPRFMEAWAAFHGGSPPPLTLAYVAGLARPEYLVEIEVWAARPKAR
ncbi:MAG: RidA family protein [Pseudomonadota bacterium]|nr:RidA family protein [Pseudomonadota bacterium]